AIEYRAEAYLGLDRVEEAKKAYMALFTGDRGRADELLQAMKGWVEKRRAEPGTLAPDTVQEFSRWVGQREELAGQTPSVSELQQRKWGPRRRIPRPRPTNGGSRPPPPCQGAPPTPR